MSWKVTTPVASQGGEGTLSSANNWSITIAQLDIDSDNGEAAQFGIYFGTDPAGLTIHEDSSNVATEALQWTVQWGYGNCIFNETYPANVGFVAKVGEFCRVTASLVPAGTGTSINAASTVKVRAMIIPSAPTTELRKATLVFNFNNLSAANVKLPTGAAAPGVLPVKKSVPIQLLSCWGYNYSGVDGYLMLFDTFSVGPVAGAIPSYSVAKVPAGATFSADWENDPLSFTAGLFFGMSSTGDVWTSAPTATLNSNWETLPYSAF